MLWELSNPSDKIIFDAPDLRFAAAIVGHLGNKYGAVSEDGQLDCCSFAAFHTMEKLNLTPDQLKIWKDEHQGGSMNDICGRAYKIANALEAYIPPGTTEDEADNK
jgi:hypothetical protein